MLELSNDNFGDHRIRVTNEKGAYSEESRSLIECKQRPLDYYISEKVQSNYNIKFIQQKMKEFNKSLFTYLDSIDFEKNLLALKYDIKLPENNLSENYLKYLDEIASRHFLFNKQELLLKLIDTLNLNKLKKFIQIYITENNKTYIIIQG